MGASMCPETADFKAELGTLPFCTNLMQKLLGNACPQKAANGSANGNGGGLVPSGVELEVLPFCTNFMQKIMPQACPEKAANGSAPGNGGGLVPSGLEAYMKLQMFP